MATVVLPAWEGLAGLAAAAVSALGIRGLLEDVDTTPRSKERDCADTPDDTVCKQCHLGNGLLGQARQPRYINAKTLVNYRYQLYIANLYAAPERFTFTTFGDAANEEVNVTWERIKEFFTRIEKPLTTTEWLYKGTWFDGFWRRYCTVVEAKGRYAHFFNGDNPDDDYVWGAAEVRKWSAVQKAQLALIAVAMPRGRLEWHFMEELPYLRALNAGMPTNVTKLTPFASI